MRTLTTRVTTALLLAAGAGLVSLVSPRDLISQAALAATGDGRGDNPVVGSLPCVVDDDLDLKFFNWMGMQTPPPGFIQYYEPTLAFVGGSNLESYIVDAQGTPNGMVNASSNWTAIGSILQMQVVSDRVAATKMFDVVIWVPDQFIGGGVQMSSTIGGSMHTLAGNTFSLPVAALAASPGLTESGMLTVTSADGSETCTVQVDVIGPLVIVDFQP